MDGSSPFCTCRGVNFRTGLLHNTENNPKSTNINTIPLSQPQSNLTPIEITNGNLLSPLSSTNLHNNTLTCNETTNNNILPPNHLLQLYHDNQIHYILEEFCQPVSESFTNNPVNVCKFNRECLVAKNKVVTKAPIIASLSPTAFGMVPNLTKKTTI